MWNRERGGKTWNRSRNEKYKVDRQRLMKETAIIIVFEGRRKGR